MIEAMKMQNSLTAVKQAKVKILNTDSGWGFGYYYHFNHLFLMGFNYVVYVEKLRLLYFSTRKPQCLISTMQAQLKHGIFVPLHQINNRCILLN